MKTTEKENTQEVQLKDIQIGISCEDGISKSDLYDIKYTLMLIKQLHPNLYIFYETEQNAEVIK